MRRVYSDIWQRRLLGLKYNQEGLSRAWEEKTMDELNISAIIVFGGIAFLVSLMTCLALRGEHKDHKIKK